MGGTSRFGRNRWSFGRVSRLVAIGAISTTMTALGGATVSASSAPAPLNRVSTVLTSTVPTLVHDAVNLGDVASSRVLTLAAPLEIPNIGALNTFVQNQYTSTSANFHNFLTPTTFGQRFGADLADVDGTVAALKGLGFKVTAPSANHLYVDFSGTVGLIDQVFGVTLANLHLSTGQNFFSNLQNITLPGVLHGLVSGIVGMDSLGEPHSNLLRAPYREAQPIKDQVLVGDDGGASPCVQAVAGAGYTAPELATAYNFNGLYAKGLLGQGESASLVEFDDYHDSNVAGVESCYGLDTPVIRRLVDGGTGGPPAEGEAEDMADITTILEMVPKLAHLYVYVAPITGTGEIDLYNQFVTDDNSPVLSSSWGDCEELNSQADNRLFSAITEEAAAQGQSIFDAAGDSGATDCGGFPDPVGDSITVEQESGDPWVTGVGGTDLAISSVLGVHAEDTWNDAGAGGGGQSSFWTMPWYQKQLPSALSAPGANGAVCGAPAGELCREVPDLSANADPDFGLIGREKNPQFVDGSPGFSIYCNTPNCALLPSVTGEPIPSLPGGLLGWEPIGGTSLATPLTASAAVLWNQEARTAGLSGIGFINPPLYQVARNPSEYASDFYDITTDSNDSQYESSCPAGCNVNHLYAATTGYDMASGLGSYNAGNLGADLVKTAAEIAVTPNQVQLYGYTKGVDTTTPVSVTSGFFGDPFSATSDASWLHVRSGDLGSSLHYFADPSGLAPGNYVGHITITSQGQSATLAVAYQVTPPGKLVVSPGTVTFTERAINTSNQTVSAVCNDTLWNDEFAGTVGDATISADPSTKANLFIADRGAKGSVVHWSAFFYSNASDWLGQDLDPKGAQAAQMGGKPIVNTAGQIGVGKLPDVVALASLADGNALGGYPRMNQGTYHGVIAIADLAAPNKPVFVPAVMILGNGKDTPTIAASPSALSVSLPSNSSKSVTVTLSDASHDCGYVYSAQSSVPWASISPDYFSGTVAATGSSASSSSGDTGDGTGAIPITFDTTGMAPGTYHGDLIIQSQNAEPNPRYVPFTLTVTK